MQKLLAAELLFIMLILFVNYGKGLNCFVCRSDVDEGCSGDMNQSLSVECPNKTGHTKVYCRKIQQQLKFLGQNNITDIRECAYEKGSDDCYLSKWKSVAYQLTCECEEDSCNRGSSQILNILIFTTLIYMGMLII